MLLFINMRTALSHRRRRSRSQLRRAAAVRLIPPAIMHLCKLLDVVNMP